MSLNDDRRPQPAGRGIDLTRFQLEALVEIARVQASDDLCYGLAIKDELQECYEETVRHGRLYPNLDELVEKGFVEKFEVDNRTNGYELTDAGYDVLVEEHDRLAEAINEVAGADLPLAGGDD